MELKAVSLHRLTVLHFLHCVINYCLCVCVPTNIIYQPKDSRAHRHTCHYKFMASILISILTIAVLHLPPFSTLNDNFKQSSLSQISNLHSSSITLNRWPCLLLHRKNRNHQTETFQLPTTKPTNPPESVHTLSP